MDSILKKHFPHRRNWRKWLEENHNRVKEIWMIFYKKHTKVKNISYDEAVEEAVCFGWIDSTIKRVDDKTYIQKFTPRNLKSKWSILNVKRAKKMINEKRMTENGLKKFNYAIENKLLYEEKKIDKIPDFIINKIKQDKKAYENYNKYTVKQRTHFILWILDGKKEETRLRRLVKTIKMLNENKKLGMQ